MANGDLMGAKDAVSIALSYVQDMIPGIGYPTLEEIELSEEEEYWLVTIGYDDRSVYPSERKYKIIKVDAVTGEVISMKIRSFG